MLKRLLNELIPDFSVSQIDNSFYKFSRQFVGSLLWLLCCTFLIYYLEIENNQRFHKVAIILTGAFFLYILVPLKYRKLFLVALTFFIEVYLLGVKLALGVFVMMLYFVALTYIRNKTLRSVAVVISTLICILIFSKIIAVPFVRHVLLFGALFLMLRYIYFLYELNYFKTPPLFIDRLGYLFLIPNACFPLFPALDPKEYLTSFYNVPSAVSLNRALHNVTVGIIHLLIYRIIYLYFSPSTYEIEGFWDWLVFILSSYSLIFRLSGLFYLAIGFLELFGFKFLPVFDYVYFASGFADLWRRVNLNWRAFMMRVFYYPLMFKLKQYNPKIVLFVCINIMFFVTWFLHSWQWYWIKGSYYFYATDMIFWGILGLMISINSVKVYVDFSTKPAGQSVSTNHFKSAAKIVFMFFLMSVLWSLWTSSSLTEFFYINTFAGNGSIKDYGLFLLALAGIVIVAGIIRYLHFEKKWFTFLFKEIKPLYGIGICVIISGILFSLDKTNYNKEVESFLSMNLNQKDKSVLERGYYDQILNNDDKSVELVNIGNKFTKWNVDNKAYVRTNNELMKEFIPNFATTFKGDTLSTNSLGLRDKEYTLQKAGNTVRMAFLGGSYIMGSGVSNEENFAALTEKKINTTKESPVEILNFGAGGYHLIQCVFIVDNKLPKFNADYMFYFIHSSDRNRCLDDLVNLFQKNTRFSYPFLQSAIEKAKVKKGMCRLEIYNRLKPYINDIMIWGYKRIYDRCIEQKIIPVIVYLPTNANLRKDLDKEFCMNIAGQTGFHIIDLTSVYDGYHPKDIQLALWDAHPNEKGHKIIADKLLGEMEKERHFFTFIK